MIWHRTKDSSKCAHLKSCNQQTSGILVWMINWLSKFHGFTNWLTNCISSTCSKQLISSLCFCSTLTCPNIYTGYSELQPVATSCMLLFTQRLLGRANTDLSSEYAASNSDGDPEEGKSQRPWERQEDSAGGSESKNDPPLDLWSG